MKIRFYAAGWSVRITWSGINLQPIDVRQQVGVSGRLRRAVTQWLTNAF